MSNYAYVYFHAPDDDELTLEQKDGDATSSDGEAPYQMRLESEDVILVEWAGDKWHITMDHATTEINLTFFLNNDSSGNDNSHIDWYFPSDVITDWSLNGSVPVETSRLPGTGHDYSVTFQFTLAKEDVSFNVHLDKYRDGVFESLYSWPVTCHINQVVTCATINFDEEGTTVTALNDGETGNSQFTVDVECTDTNIYYDTDLASDSDSSIGWTFVSKTDSSTDNSAYFTIVQTAFDAGWRWDENVDLISYNDYAGSTTYTVECIAESETVLKLTFSDPGNDDTSEAKFTLHPSKDGTVWDWDPELKARGSGS